MAKRIQQRVSINGETRWISGSTQQELFDAYLEQAMRLPKVYGDLFGAALFAVMLGTGRTLYSKYGKNIHNII